VGGFVSKAKEQTNTTMRAQNVWQPLAEREREKEREDKTHIELTLTLDCLAL